MTVYTLIIGISWGVLLMYWVVSALFVKRDRSGEPWWRSAWWRIFFVVIVLGILSNAPLKNAARTLHFFNTQSEIAGIVGALLCVCGIALALLARMHLGRNWSPAPAVKEEHELVTSGPYKLIRHPIYSGLLLAILGTTIVSPIWVFGVVVFGIMFAGRVGREEQLMLAQFPNQYPAYRARTWALIPFLW